MNILARGMVVGGAYALAVTCIDMGLGSLHIIEMRAPALPVYQAKAAGLEVLLGVALGLLAAPLLALRVGRLWHLVALVGLWTVLSHLVALDPSRPGSWLVPPLGGLVLLLVGAIVARRWRRLPWAIGVAALAAAVATPVVSERLRGSPRASLAPTASAPAGAPDIVMVVLDTVRAASMSAYGYERPTTPVFDRLAEEGALFLDATAPSTWSLPSHASLFTGRFPSGHGASLERRWLAPGIPTLAEILAAAGYETRCFTSNPHISESFGLTRGFAWSDRAWLAGAGARSFVFVFRVLDWLGFGIEDKGGGQVAQNFERWVAARGAQDPPVFAFLNFLEAHFPYHQVPDESLRRFSSLPRPVLRAHSVKVFAAQFGRSLTPAEVAEARKPATDMYDAGVYYSDSLLGRVVAALRDAGTLDETVLVVLSDHGEMLGEHGDFGHGASLHQPDLHVPLLVRYPPRIPGGSRVAEPVSTVGVLATVLDLGGLEAPAPLHVGSLLLALEGRPAGQPVIAERFADAPHQGATGPLLMRDRRYRVYRSGSKKLVLTSRDERLLFDLARDPGELQDLAGRDATERTRLERELEDWSRALGLPAIDAAMEEGAAPEVDPAARERLRALGYVE